MPSFRGDPLQIVTIPSSHRNDRDGAAGLFELQLRRKLLQQQLGAVDQRCRRVAQVLAKKQLSKLSHHKGNGSGNTTGPTNVLLACGEGKAEKKFVQNNIETDHWGGRRKHTGGGARSGVHSMTAQSAEMDGHDKRGKLITHKKSKEMQPLPVQLPTAAPFRRGSCVDHTNKKHLLRDKQRALGREAALERRPHGPKMLNVRDEVAVVPSAFPDRYLKGEVPCSKHCSIANTLVWVCPLEQLDYNYYLPMFFDGIRCLEDPCKTLARQGVCDLLEAAKGSPQRILPSLPGIMRAIRTAISCKNPELLVFTCTALCTLASGNKEVGAALVPHYKMFLNVFNMFVNVVKNTGDKIDYGQRNRQDIGEAITATLETLERYGGKYSFARIKQCIPTCE